MREWRTKNPDWKTNNEEYRKRLRLEVLTHYSNGTPKCACCSESNIQFLEMDHIDGGGTAHRKTLAASSHGFLARIKRMGFPDGLRVLCSNCYKAVSHYGSCPHPNGVTGLRLFRPGRPKVYTD